MKRSFRVGTFSGIDVNLHWTFSLMLGGMFLFYLYQTASLLIAAAGIALLSTVFLCVVLHEYGHALMARRYGISTLDITLYPIGGVARLERMPKEPMQELWIALAGPAVNLAIAGLLYFGSGLFGASVTVEHLAAAPPTNIIGMLIWFNLVMVGFNMIPAFPMDGGRVLRAGLATNMGHSRATQIAGVIGQGVAVIMAIYGMFTAQYMLIFIAIFVIVAAKQEMEHAIMK
ncbi:MAG: site-2 protease family protein [Rhodothermales bacterium]